MMDSFLSLLTIIIYMDEILPKQKTCNVAEDHISVALARNWD